MKIGFKKVGSTAIAFDITYEELNFTGRLVKFSRSLVELEAKITGGLVLPCDICAEEFNDSVNENVKFYLCDGVCKSEDSEYDIVEINNSIIDINEILSSEIELYKSNYFSCESCKS